MTNRSQPGEEPGSYGSLGATWLLVTDVDDTLLGDDLALAEFIRTTDQVPDLVVILNSSRPVASVKKTLQSLDSPPGVSGIIGALGTQVELGGQRVLTWERRFHGWDRAPVDEAMCALGFRKHEAEFQTRLKASYTVPGDRVDDARLAVTATGVVARIICSGEDSFDVIPPNAGKGEATRFVATLLGVPDARLITAGDSANDEDLLRTGRGIVVANASSRLRKRLDGADVYLASRSHAAGILEGLHRLGVPIRKEGTR